ncbi:MAG: hypothetical protein ACFB22_10190 [Rhodothalassiaceae bacterium]
MRYSLLLGVVVAGTVLSAPQPAQAQTCLTEPERQAREIRHLQTQLMVGALQCRGSRDHGQRDNYNAFVTQNKGHLADHAQQLIAGFKRQYGPRHQKHLDAFITKLANDISLRSQRVGNFCQRIADLGAYLTQGEGRNWAQAVALAPVRFQPPVASCEKDASATTIAVD